MKHDGEKRQDEPRVRLGEAVATGWFARDLIESRLIVSTWPRSMRGWLTPEEKATLSSTGTDKEG